MPDVRYCSECSAELRAAEQNSLCPRCLLLLAARPTSGPVEDFGSSDDTAPLELFIRKFGDYELLEEIGRGGLIDHFDQPRVTDFGLAKRLNSDSDLTVTGQVLGSPNYMSPEQAIGGSRAGGATYLRWVLCSII